MGDKEEPPFDHLRGRRGAANVTGLAGSLAAETSDYPSDGFVPFGLKHNRNETRRLAAGLSQITVLLVSQQIAAI